MTTGVGPNQEELVREACRGVVEVDVRDNHSNARDKKRAESTLGKKGGEEENDWDS